MPSRSEIVHPVLDDCNRMLNYHAPRGGSITAISGAPGFGKSRLLLDLNYAISDEYRTQIGVALLDFRDAPVDSRISLLLRLQGHLDTVGLRTTNTRKQFDLLREAGSKLSREAQRSPEDYNKAIQEAGRSMTRGLLSRGADMVAAGAGAILEPVIDLLTDAVDPVLRAGVELFARRTAAAGRFRPEHVALVENPARCVASALSMDLITHSAKTPIVCLIDTAEEIAEHLAWLVREVAIPSATGDVAWVIAGQGLSAEAYPDLVIDSSGDINFVELPTLTTDEVESVLHEVWPDAAGEPLATRVHSACFGIPLLLVLIIEGTSADDWAESEGRTRLTTFQSNRRDAALGVLVEQLLRSLHEDARRFLLLLAIARATYDREDVRSTAQRLSLPEAGPQLGRLLATRRLHASIEEAVRREASRPGGRLSSDLPAVASAWAAETTARVQRAIVTYSDAFAAWRSADFQELILIETDAAYWSQDANVATRKAAQHLMLSLAPSDRFTAKILGLVRTSAIDHTSHLGRVERAAIRNFVLLCTGEVFLPGVTVTYWHEYKGAARGLQELTAVLHKLSLEPSTVYHSRLLQLEVRIRRRQAPMRIDEMLADFGRLDEAYRESWGQYATWLFATWYQQQRGMGGKASPQPILALALQYEQKRPGLLIDLALDHAVAEAPDFLRVARRVLDLAPYDPALVVRASNILADHGYADEALEACLTTLASSGDDISLLYQAGYSAICAGECTRAAGLIEAYVNVKIRAAVEMPSEQQLQLYALLDMTRALAGLPPAVTASGGDSSGDWSHIYIGAAAVVRQPGSETRERLWSSVQALHSHSVRDQLVRMLYESSIHLASGEPDVAVQALESGVRALRRANCGVIPPAPEMVTICHALTGAFPASSAFNRLVLRVSLAGDPDAA